MKLRVRFNRQTTRVESLGEDPSVNEVKVHIRETLLPAHGLSTDTEFSLSLNGSELLSDADQTLSSFGVVSGDLICVILPESAPTAADTSNSSTSSHHETSSSSQQQQSLTAAVTSDQPSSSSSAALIQNQETLLLGPEPSVPRWEPMLCSEAEEGQAPLSLELLYHAAQTSSPSDAVMVAGNLLMLETGFIPKGHEPKASEMPAGWRLAGGVYKIEYSHPLCESSPAVVVAVCMGPVLVINATLKVDGAVDTVRKLCVSPSRYVTSNWAGESAAAAFRDLRKLSRIFKDQLAYPLIAAAREAMALPVAFGLAALPPELLLRVIRLLDVRSVVSLSSVCRHFNVAADDSTLWRHLYRRDFTDAGPSRSRDTDWKELYKRSYKLHCEYRHLDRRRRRSLPPPRGIFISVPTPLFPSVPGIIGGEYDQRPSFPHGLLPRPRFDPIGPPNILPVNDLRPRPMRGRPADIRRGFI